MFFGLGPVFSEHHFGGTAIPVSIEIYFVAQLAAVVLLFEAGLENQPCQLLQILQTGYGGSGGWSVTAVRTWVFRDATIRVCFFWKHPIAYAGSFRGGRNDGHIGRHHRPCTGRHG